MNAYVENFYRHKVKDMIQDEPMAFTLGRYKQDWRTAESFWDDHRRVHYCCYGGKTCPMCPAHYSMQDALGDLDWLLTKLHKKYKLDVYRHIKPNKTWTWNVHNTSSPN